MSEKPAKVDKPKLSTEEVQRLRSTMRSLSSNAEFLKTRFSAGGASTRTAETLRKIRTDLEIVEAMFEKLNK